MVLWFQVVALNIVFWILSPIVTVLFAVGGAVYVTAFGLCVRDRRRTMRLIRRTISHYGTAVVYCSWPLVRVRYVDHAPEEKRAIRFRGESPVGIETRF